MTESRNINRRLEKLIVFYGIDRFHPGFQKKIRAQELITDFVNAYANQKCILIARDETDKAFFSFYVKDVVLSEVVLYKELDDAKLQWLSEAEKECNLLLISYYGREELMNRLYNNGLQPISLYEYFETKGFICNGNFYEVFNREHYNFHGGIPTFDYTHLDMNAVFFYDRRGYENSATKELKEVYLAKMIFDCVYVKDFERMEQYIEVYCEQKYYNYKEYKEFQKAVTDLMCDIKEMIQQRDKKDIIMFWIDALEHGEDKDMPFLSSLQSKSLDFENAYTVTPYTHSTIKALFEGKYTVDDRAYRMQIDNSSKLVSMLKNRGYRVHFYTYLNQVNSKLKGLPAQSMYTVLPELCWELINDLINEELPLFVLLHEFPHTHVPYTSLGLTGKEYSFREDRSDISAEEETIRKGQIAESRVATDKVLQYYSNFLNDTMFKIYMSDHGHTYLDRYHAIFRVVQKDIAPKQVKGMFSYVQFPKLISKLLDGNQEYAELCSSYVKIQDVDFYSQNNIKYFFSDRDRLDFKGLVGYEGIVTEQEYYLRYNDGREEFYCNKEGQELTEERMNALRELCPTYPADILEDEKFHYSKWMYRTTERYLERNKEFEETKLSQVVAIFEELPKEAVVALRGGGVHTYRLWQALPWHLKKRISYVIDLDVNCMASRVGLNVITLDELPEKQINYVVVSSFEREEQWMKELRERTSGCQIIGLYQELEKRGVHCKRAFYHHEYVEDDIVMEG